MLAYFDSKISMKPCTIDEFVSYLNVIENKDLNPHYNAIKKAGQNLTKNSYNALINEVGNQMTQGKLIQFDFGTLSSFKDFFKKENNKLEEVVDETIKQKTHILKNLHQTIKGSNKFGIDRFFVKKDFKSKGIDNNKNFEIVTFSKNGKNLFSYDQKSDVLYIERSDIRVSSITVNIKHDNGYFNISNDCSFIHSNVNRKDNKRLKI